MNNVRCWNCGQDFEHLNSAQNSNKQHKLTATHIEELLLANMFDGHGGGIVSMRVDDLVYEVAQLIAEELSMNKDDAAYVYEQGRSLRDEQRGIDIWMQDIQRGLDKWKEDIEVAYWQGYNNAMTDRDIDESEI